VRTILIAVALGVRRVPAAKTPPRGVQTIPVRTILIAVALGVRRVPRLLLLLLLFLLLILVRL
jgi:hypothetical protein